jgi:hypothetical protein
MCDVSSTVSRHGRQKLTAHYDGSTYKTLPPFCTPHGLLNRFVVMT